MDNNTTITNPSDPTIEVGVDQFTAVITPINYNFDCSWEENSIELIEEFLNLSEAEDFLGPLEKSEVGLTQGYTKGFVIADRPYHFAISFHPDYPRMGICVQFSAHAYAVYCEEYKKAYDKPMNAMRFLRMVRADDLALPIEPLYNIRLSRIDLVIDFKNFSHGYVNPNTIYKKLLNNSLVVRNHAGKELIRSISSFNKNGTFETVYVGQKKGNTNGFMWIYNKRLEQLETKGFRLDEAFKTSQWIRFEAVFKGTYAHQITETLMDENLIQSEDELKQFIAGKITEKYQFWHICKDDKGNIVEFATDYTEEMCMIAANANYGLLSCPSPRDNDLRRSVAYQIHGSGLFSTLYKARRIWPTVPGADKKLLRHLFHIYTTQYIPMADEDKELQIWLGKHLVEHQKESFSDFLKHF